MTQRRQFPVLEAVIAASALALLATAAYFTGRHTDQNAHGYNTYSSYDAASGGYRAWYELLDRQGVRVERFERRPAFLDASVDVYLMAGNLSAELASASTSGNSEYMTSGDWDALAKWIKAGGRFVWLADGLTEPKYVNVPPLRESGPATDAAVAVAPSTLSVGVNAVSGTSHLRVPFATSTEAAPVIADDTGGVVVSYRLGKGTVTVVTDESLFDNERLTDADNARLAYNLATARLSEHGSVAFDEWTHGFAAGDTWWQVLPRPFQVASVAIAVAFAMLLIGTGFRFGPTARLPDESERTSAEYLSSMALLYERGGAIRHAIRDLADACMRDVAHSLGLAETTPARTIAGRIAGGDAQNERAEHVMELDRLRSFEFPHAADLMRAAHHCAALRKEYTRHGRIGIRRRPSTAGRTA